MALTIALNRQVKVRSYRFAGTVAMAEPRQELVAVLKAITELGGEIGPHDLVGYLVPEAFSAAADRLLVIASLHGLVERTDVGFRLTDAGERARDVEHVLVPRDGTWRVWLASDPLLPSALVHVEAVHSASAFDDLEATNARRGSKGIERSSVPRELQASVGLECHSLAGKRRTIRIDHAGEAVTEEPSEDDLSVVLELSSAGSARVTLRGEIVTSAPGGQSTTLGVDTPVPPPRVEWEDVINALLQQAGIEAAWDSRANVVRCDCDGLDAGAIQSMRRTVAIRMLDLRSTGLGSFQAVSVPDVPLNASTEAVAQRWATLRLLSGIEEHQTAARYLRSLERASEPFAEFRPSLPARDALLASVTPQAPERGRDKPRSPRLWRLQAPSDFQL